MIKPSTLSGFMELLPEEQIIFERYKNIIEETYSNYGFTPLDTPIIEKKEILLAKAGGETEKQIYQFKKGDNDLCLRFDLTVPLAKYVAINQNKLAFPFKRYQIGKVYRGERAQKGRFREFYQCDIDVIGDGELSIMNDVMIPKIIAEIIEKMNIGDFEICINNRKILEGFFNSLNIKDKLPEILRVIDKIEKITKEEFIEELLDLGLKEVEKICQFININGTNKEIIKELKELKITDEVFNEGLNELEFVINSLEQFNVKQAKIDLKIARGLDYYTGTVYETFLKDYKNIGSISSGGRYENLAEYYTERNLPGVGMSIGLTRLFYNLLQEGVIKTENASIIDYLIIPMDNDYEYAIEIMSQLKYPKMDICTIEKGFKQKMKYANKINAKNVIIIGSEEKENREYIIKNMETGNQEKYKLN